MTKDTRLRIVVMPFNVFLRYGSLRMGSIVNIAPVMYNPVYSLRVMLLCWTHVNLIEALFSPRRSVRYSNSRAIFFVTEISQGK